MRMIWHKRISPFPFAGALILLLAGCHTATPENHSATDVLHLGRLTFEPCYLQTSGAQPPVSAYCSRLSVPENTDPTEIHADRLINLGIAWLPPRQRSGIAADPVFFISGGPGQSAQQSYLQVAAAFAELRRTRGIILLDQRGTGTSNRLTCTLPDDESASIQALQTAAQQCVEELSTNANLRHYTTLDAVADLESVRQAIGAQQINLIGVSYGTRVAQHYARHYPGSTRTLVLDSPVPNEVSLATISARNLDEALALQFAHCKADPNCYQALGDPQAELARLLNQLRAQPPVVQYRDANSGHMREDTLHAENVAAWVRLYAYHPSSAALLPQLIHQANHGHYSELMALTQLTREQMHDSLALGMQLSVICSEDAPLLSTLPDDSDTVLGNRPAQVLATLCEVWPQTAMPADFYQPLSNTVPALLLSGEFDPITPPRYGQQIAATLPNARHLILLGQGHAVLNNGCVSKLLARFMETADAQHLATACLDQLQPTPPFTSFNGWEP